MDSTHRETGRILEPLSDRMSMCFSSRKHIGMSNLSGSGFSIWGET